MPGNTPQPSNGIAALVESLNNILADYFALYLKTKNFHWHVSGPHFRDYHLMLDEQAAQIFARTDEIAERVRKLGAPTLRSIGEIGDRQRVVDSDTSELTPNAMLRELQDDNRNMIVNLRGLKRLADAAGDNATSGLLDGWTDEAERRAWFLESAGSPLMGCQVSSEDC